MTVQLTVLEHPNPDLLIVAIPKKGKTKEEILNALQDNEDLVRLQNPKLNDNVSVTSDMDEALGAAFGDSNAANAIECIILLGVSQIVPYYSESDRNKALLHPFMLLLRIALFCPLDFVFHTVECLHSLMTFQFLKAFSAFIKLLCDIVGIILHAAVNLPLACTGIIMRNIATFLFDCQLLDDLFPAEAIATEIDQHLDQAIYNTANNMKFFDFSNNKAEVHEVATSIYVPTCG